MDQSGESRKSVRTEYAVRLWSRVSVNGQGHKPEGKIASAEAGATTLPANAANSAEAVATRDQERKAEGARGAP